MINFIKKFLKIFQSEKIKLNKKERERERERETVRNSMGKRLREKLKLINFEIS